MIVKKSKLDFYPYFLLAPSLIFILVIVAWPLIETFRLSLTDARLGGESYIGFENYQELLEKKKFHRVITRTFFLDVFISWFENFIGLSWSNAFKRCGTRTGSF